jgi:hypothetical protein
LQAGHATTTSTQPTDALADQSSEELLRQRVSQHLLPNAWTLRPWHRRRLGAGAERLQQLVLGSLLTLPPFSGFLTATG